MISSLFIVDGALDRPLLHSQGLPLLRRLSMHGYDCYVQSFEETDQSMNTILEQEIKEKKITWLPIFIGKNSLGIQRIVVILSGFVQALKLCRQRQINVIHCRSYRPAAIGGLIKLFLGNGFLFDMRGFLIDEFVADGHWKGDDLKYRIAKYVERLLILSADAIIVTSPQFKGAVLSLPFFPISLKDQVISIPNCVDTNRFPLVDSKGRKALREKLGWDNRLIAVFSGDAFRYRDTLEDITSFFKMLLHARPDAFLVLAVYGDSNNFYSDELTALGKENFMITSVSPQDMPDFLAAADIGLSFFKSKNFSNAIASPIKFAEYLSSGLPVVINPGIGDTGRIIEQYNVGVVIDPKDSEQAKLGVNTLLKMLATHTDLQQRCHETAQKELSFDLAEKLYLQAYQMVAAISDHRMKR